MGEDDGSFNLSDEVWFYGRSVNDWEPVWDSKESRYRYKHYNNPYTDQNVYWLNVDADGNYGMRMESLDYDDAFILNPTSTLDYYYLEEDTYAIYDDFNLPRYMPNLYGSLFTGNTSSRTFNVNIEDVVDYASASLVLNFISNDPVDHQFSVFVNGMFIDNTPIKKYSLIDTIEIAEGILIRGNNSIRFDHNTNGSCYLNYFELEYTRSLVASTDELFFLSPPSDGSCRYQIGGLAEPWIFDITEYNDVKVIQSDEMTDLISVMNPRRYLAIEQSALRTPNSIHKDNRGADEYTHLRATLGADILVIAADQYYDAMEGYEDFRETSAEVPMEVLRIKISDIYDEYGWGLPDPAAIRDFLKSTLPVYNWAVSPIYVLFAGDGDWDYKNSLNAGDANWVIPYVDNVRCTDDWYSYFNPFDDYYSYPQLVSGRWPARSVEEIEYMVDRVIHYEGNPEFGSWKIQPLFVADDEFAQGGDAQQFEQKHTVDTESIAENLIPDIFNTKKIFMTEYPASADPTGGGLRKPEASQELIKETAWRVDPIFEKERTGLELAVRF